MKISKKTRDYLIIVIGGTFILSVLFLGLYFTKSLEENGVETKGMLFETRQWKGRSYVLYRYVVDGEEYSNSIKYNPENEYFELGDSCRVVYDSINPSISKVLKDKDGWYSIRKRESQ